MMEFEHGGGLGGSGKKGDGKDSREPENLPVGPCVSTKTPAGFDVGPLREKLEGWLRHDPKMTMSDFVQTDGSGCFERASDRIPKKWNLVKEVVTCEAPYAGFVEGVTAKLNSKTFKPKVCICQYFKGNPIAGPLSTFGMHWILIIGAGTNTGGRRFLVVYDPDGDATARSKKMWDPCRKLDFESAPVAEDVLLKLVLGEGNKLGGLIRYFYA